MEENIASSISDRKQNFFDKRKNAILYLVMGIVGLILFVWGSVLVDGHKWPFEEYPEIKLYCGTNVVSGFANFSYFTYLSLILFSLWSILYFFAFTFRCYKLKNFLQNEATVAFVITNYVITCVFYTVFELLKSPPTFSLYDVHEPYAWFSFSTNIIIHYIYTVFAFVMFFKIDVRHAKRKVYYFIPLLYLIVYFVAVKITGMYVYSIEWYPYPLFHPQLMNEMLGINGSDGIGYLLMILVAVVLLSFYFGIYFTAIKLKKRNCIL